MKVVAKKSSSQEAHIAKRFGTKNGIHSSSRGAFAFANHQPIIQRKPGCPCGGGCPRCKAESFIQPKLKIGERNDKYEQEADRVAEQVMHMPDQEVSGISKGSAKIQRKCAACQSGEGLSPKCAEEEEIQRKTLAMTNTPMIWRQSEETEEEEEEEILQTKEVPGQTPEVTPSLASRINAVRGSSSQPLPESVRSFFQPRFGRDFSGVRVHTGVRATEAAQAVNARAFTVGGDVVFGSGEYAPGTAAGRRLLAHELTHVVQQRKDGDSAAHELVRSSQRTVPLIHRIGESQLQRQGGGQPAKGAKKKPTLPKAILQEVNAKRGKVGSLHWNDTLAKSAAAYCKVMIQKQEFSHSADGKTIFQRISDAGYFPSGGGGKAGENLYYNPKVFTAQDAVTWWMGSPPHKKVIMEPKYEEAGVTICTGKVKINRKVRRVHITVMHFGAIHPTLTLSNPAGKRTGGKTILWTVTGSVSDNIDPPTSITVKVKVGKLEKGITVAKLPTNPLTVKKDGSFSFTFETKGTGLAVLKTTAKDTHGNSPKPETTNVRVNP